MMKKFAIVFLTAAMTLGSGAAMAASNNGTANQAADAGAAAGGAKQNLQPNNVDNSQINTGSGTSGTATDSSNMTADEIHKNAQCKDGKCPDVNKKVETKVGGGDVNTKTDGTTQ
ncbi:YbgS-like family protein [Winslowiella sp. 2C04]|uniref:YbgS-like family protein n=1 Tax=Winslowiella sp. 2C04 TaxID=3416179 RepID=UPI003CEB9F11